MENISTTEMTHTDWLKARKKGIGGSDAAAICGLSPWKSPMSVYLSKVDEYPAEEENSEACYWGTTLEAAVADRYAEITGNKVRRNNKMMFSNTHPFMLANIDRDVFSDTEGRFGLECKTTSAFKADEWADNQVPIYYVLQVQHYMAVTGYPFFDVACLIGGNNFQVRRVMRDEEIISELIARESEFWHENVEKKICPAWDGSEDGFKLLKAMYPKSEAAKIADLSAPLLGTIDEYQRLSGEIKELAAQTKALERERDVYKQAIIAEMADAERGFIGNWQVDYKTTIRKGYVTQDTSYRTLKIKEIKEK